MCVIMQMNCMSNFASTLNVNEHAYVHNTSK